MYILLSLIKNIFIVNQHFGFKTFIKKLNVCLPCLPSCLFLSLNDLLSGITIVLPFPPVYIICYFLFKTFTMNVILYVTNDTCFTQRYSKCFHWKNRSLTELWIRWVFHIPRSLYDPQHRAKLSHKRYIVGNRPVYSLSSPLTEQCPI